MLRINENNTDIRLDWIAEKKPFVAALAVKAYRDHDVRIVDEILQTDDAIREFLDAVNYGSPEDELSAVDRLAEFGIMPEGLSRRSELSSRDRDSLLELRGLISHKISSEYAERGRGGELG